MAISYKIIGRHIRAARKNCKFTQEHVAELMKISVAHYGRLERGEREINLERLAQISILFCVPIESLVEGSVLDAPSKEQADVKKGDFINRMTQYTSYCREETLLRILRVCDALAIEDKEQI